MKLIISDLIIIFFYNELFNFFKKSLSSGNEFIDKFIQDAQLRWFPYNNFKNIKYLDQGGFSTIYTTNWLNDTGLLVLKSLNNSNEDINEILNEVL